jgi:hypothetical protein
MDDLYERLQSIAPHMNTLRRRWFARVRYDMLADALWWSDERPDFSDAEDHWCLQPVFRYHTSLIVGVDEHEWLPFWRRAMELFPKWPGFHPSRTSPNEKLAAFYKRESKSAIDSFLECFVDPKFRGDLRREIDG